MAGFGLSDPRTICLALAAEASRSRVDLTIDNYSSAGATIEDGARSLARISKADAAPDGVLITLGLGDAYFGVTPKHLAEHLDRLLDGVTSTVAAAQIYPLACAAALPQRITRVATVSSVAPPPAKNRGLHPMFRVVNGFMKHPTLYRTVARSQLRQMSKHPDRWLGAWAKMQPADGAMFREHPHIASMVLEEMTEAVRAGPAGLVHEASLYHRDWGFELSAIQTTTAVWHGASDRQATPAWARFLADNIPSASLTLVEGAGHFSTLIDNATTILTELATPNAGAENHNDLL